MEYLRGLAAAVKPIHPGVGAAEERQKCTTRERCEHQPAGGSAVGAGLQPGQAKEVWREPRRSTPQPLERRHAEASSSANCSHFCSHLANLRPKNLVAARLLKPATVSLLSSRSCVRITQGALAETQATAGIPEVGRKPLSVGCLGILRPLAEMVPTRASALGPCGALPQRSLAAGSHNPAVVHPAIDAPMRGSKPAPARSRAWPASKCPARP
jgi:hypothetical protein